MTATSESHAVGCAVTASRRAVDEDLRISQVEIASQARARWGWVRVGIEAVCRIEAKRGERSGLGESQNGPFGGGGVWYVLFAALANDGTGLLYQRCTRFFQDLSSQRRLELLHGQRLEALESHWKGGFVI